MNRTGPIELHLTLAPQRRFEAIDVNARIAPEAGDVLRRHSRALYCSLHTTAGYLEQSLSTRLRTADDGLVEVRRIVWRGVSAGRRVFATTAWSCAPS